MSIVVHRVFAMIVNGIVENIMVCEDPEDANILARGAYGDEAFAEDCLLYDVRMGDHWHDQNFWRVQEDGIEELIVRQPSEEEKINQLESENNELTLAMAEMIGGGADVE